MKKLLPTNTGYLPKQAGHKVFYAQYGNPQGEVIVTLHGGPGSKSKPKHVKIYDLSKYQVVTFDQRGCGESLPLGEISNNTLQDLIADMERLRIKLKIKKWFVAGGSWGSTLALAYAQEHPEQVRGLLMRGIFLARPKDAAWASTQDNGIERMFPDLREKQIEFLNKYDATPVNAAEVLLKKMKAASLEEIKAITAGVNNWEGNLMNAQADLHFTDPEEVSDEEIAAVKIFLHYEANNFFLQPDQLLKNIGAIKHIPSIIVHGRYDALCPAEQAWAVYKQLTKAEIIILPTSNHVLTADGEVAKRLAFRYFLDRHARNFDRRIEL